MARLRSQSIATLSFFSFLVLSNAIGTEEITYLLKLREAITPPLSQWFQTRDMCAWNGITCAYYDDSLYVQSIDLSSMSLTGVLPPDLSSCFQGLHFLRLQNNSFHGPLPSLRYLPELQEVYLDHNNFTSIPDNCFQGLFNLKNLSLSYNLNLQQWTFPISLTNSLKLTDLDLAATNLTGSLPDIFTSFPTLRRLDLSNNKLGGPLPSSFEFSEIQNLILHNQLSNKFSGTINVLSSMTELTEVLLQGNSFNGLIPDLYNCIKLQVLMLQDNNLTGTVPQSLMNLSSLENVSLANNWLQGPLPVFGEQVAVALGGNGFCLDHGGPCDKAVTALLEVAAGFGYPYLLARSWQGNNLCDGWRFILCDELGRIRTVNLSKLKLTGVISPAFGDLTDLWYLYLDGNDLRGLIPQILSNLPHLKVLDVSNNSLSGKVPRFSPVVLFIAKGNSLLLHDDLISQTKGTTSTSTSTSSLPPWLAGVLAGGVGLTIVMYLMIIANNRKRCFSLLQKMMIWKKTTTLPDYNVEEFIKSYQSMTLKRYSYSELKKITNSFHESLGQGGYGIVYKASLVDGRKVAVKILKESKGRGEEFVNEVITIGRTSHVNIVSLLGFCYEMNKRALVYEFMPNGSLDKFIYKKGSSTAVCDLDWSTLYRITIGIARGLEYLHQGCNTRILHLDMKPQNILLDENFVPKIADFGLAKICKKDKSVVSISGARGTLGFIAPEVFSRTYGGVSHKSDVYSFGMLILEVVGGRKNYDSGRSHTSEMYFPDWIYKSLEKGNILARCLPSTKEENDMIMKITLVSLWCIQTNPKNRPSMTKVIEMLEGLLESIPYPPKPVLHSPERLPTGFEDFEDLSSSAHESNSLATENNGSIK
ncbi:hypothetical protein PIB30_080553 [Stylosanthes scabra]|uniref:Protein kinase domain-containing protein n=1 Tax=Stylosanthes scabra TaxID=79078 RepID=A0ABU6RRW3_9FABA|nr:hypothetical protein [Stylosanthes scabra]